MACCRIMELNCCIIMHVWHRWMHDVQCGAEDGTAVTPGCRLEHSELVLNEFLSQLAFVNLEGYSPVLNGCICWEMGYRVIVVWCRARKSPYTALLRQRCFLG